MLNSERISCSYGMFKSRGYSVVNTHSSIVNASQVFGVDSETILVGTNIQGVVYLTS